MGYCRAAVRRMVLSTRLTATTSPAARDLTAGERHHRAETADYVTVTSAVASALVREGLPE